MSLTLISRVYTGLLAPVPPFTWLDVPVSTLDVLATVRLCAVMRQIREMIHHGHGHDGKREERSFPKDFIATFTVVYGGEAVSSAWLGLTPSFLTSPTFTLLYLTTQFLIDSLPSLPTMAFENEGPLTVLDAISRSFLLVDLIPPAVLHHPNVSISTNPWTLLLVTLITANGGFFMVNLFSMLHPGGWSLATPAELKAYGWTAVDLWVAPFITGLYALLTHAQPAWTQLHLAIVGFSRPVDAKSLKANPVKPWSIEDARALCAVVLWVLFATRTVNNFGIPKWKAKGKKEVMRSKIDGKRYPGTPTKTKKTE